MNPSESFFLSCDWGTSSFRLRLVDAATMAILEQTESDMGIAATFRSWQSGRGTPRQAHFSAVLQKHLTQLENKTGRSLAHLPLIISGMASASIGMVELPYGKLPVHKEGEGLVMQRLSLQPQLSNPVLLVSGVSSGRDVMRGEEIQLVGLLQDAAPDVPALVIIPGTHSKHVWITGGAVNRFATYMTGEFFQLLAQQSILAASVEAGGQWQAAACRRQFLDGVTTGSSFNLLQAGFGVRINQVLHGMDKQENYHYLSGLLIGAELRDLAQGDVPAVCLLGSEDQCARYKLALAHLFPALPVRSMSADAALVRGQATLFRQAFMV